MGRELRRVPMDFDYPLHMVWHGYLIGNVRTCFEESVYGERLCNSCKTTAKVKGVPFTSFGCPDWDEYLKEPIKKLKEMLAPPVGEGYQLWETTSEGSPISPVFATIDELCEWCENGATIIGSVKLSKEEWKKSLVEPDSPVLYESNGIVYI